MTIDWKKPVRLVEPEDFTDNKVHYIGKLRGKRICFIDGIDYIEFEETGIAKFAGDGYVLENSPPDLHVIIDNYHGENIVCESIDEVTKYIIEADYPSDFDEDDYDLIKVYRVSEQVAWRALIK